MSESSSALETALALAQGELKDPARTKVVEVRGRKDYWYAGLDDLMQSIRPVLSRHGISFSQPIETLEDGRPVLCTHLMHKDGGRITSRYPLEWKGSPQDKGSELTYARRYSLEAIVGVSATADDDGASASTSEAKQAPKQAPKPWSKDEWTTALENAGAKITLNDAIWWCVTRTTSKKLPKDLDPVTRARALSWICSDEGAREIVQAVSEQRRALQSSFFSKWGIVYPTPRKKDGADDEAIEKAESYSARCRSMVMQAWYGVESSKDVPIVHIVQGTKSLKWMRDCTQAEFESAVDEVLGQGDVP